MPKVDVLNMQGEKVSQIDLPKDVFGVEINESAMHTVVRMILNGRRAGTQSALTRSEVSGGGRKPWRQKGTGRARHGSSRSPIWRKGGVVFAPKPRSYDISVNKKVKRLALKSALSDKAKNKQIIVLDSLAFDEIKTKNMISVLKNLKVEGKALIVTGQRDENIYRSSKNIQGVLTSSSTTLNVYDILHHDMFIITKEAVEKVSEVYA